MMSERGSETDRENEVMVRKTRVRRVMHGTQCRKSAQLNLRCKYQIAVCSSQLIQAK